MPWPQVLDYNEAVQNPALCFEDVELRQGQPATDALGLPRPVTGNFAAVYQLTCPGMSVRAVKCFFREMPELQQRYQAISAHLRQTQLGVAVDCEYLARGIRVRGDWYPVVKMPWVDGVTLGEFVRDGLPRPEMLDLLARRWLLLARELRSAGVAHGDLQHSNALLLWTAADGIRLKLIDYDGLYVPALAGLPPNESGHPNYQHPQRLHSGACGPDVDRFAHLVVYGALRCLAAGGRALWGRYDNGDNLLFRADDFRAPGTSALFRELWKLPDPAARALAGHLALASLGPLGEVPLLEDLAGDGREPALTPQQERRVAVLLEAGANQGRPVLRPSMLPRPVVVNYPSAAPAPRPWSVLALGRGNVLALASALGRAVLGAVAALVLAALAQTVGASADGQSGELAAFALVAGVLGGLVGLTAGAGLADRLQIMDPWREFAAAAAGILVGAVGGALLALWAPETVATLGCLLLGGAVAAWTCHRPTLSWLAGLPRLGLRFALVPAFAAAGILGGLALRDSFPATGPGGAQVLRGHTDEVLCVAFSPVGSRVLSGSGDKTVRLWDADTGRELRRFTGHPGPVNAVAFAPDGRRALSGGDAVFPEKDFALRLWDLEAGRELGRYEGHRGTVWAVAFSPDGTRALSGGADMRARLWDVETGQELGKFEGHEDAVRSVAFSPDGRSVLTGSADKTLRLWDAGTGWESERFAEKHVVNGVAFSPDGRQALSAAADGSVRLWDLKTGKQLRLVDGPGQAIWGVAFSPDGSQALGAGADKTVRLWDVGRGRVLHTFWGHAGPVRGAAFAADGRRVDSGGEDRTVRVWKVPAP